MGCVGRLFGEHGAPAPGHPNSVRRAFRAGVSTLGGAEPTTQRGPAVHEVHETSTGGAAAARPRRRRPVRAGGSGVSDPAVRAARPLRIRRRGRAFRARGGTGGSQPAAVPVPHPGARRLAQEMQVPVATRCVLPTLAICLATSLAVSTKPVSASSTAAPNTTPSTLPSRSISGPPELPWRTVPLMVYTSRVTVV